MALYGLTALALEGYGLMRWQSYRRVRIPLHYWWPSSASNLIVVAIALISIVKTRPAGAGPDWGDRSKRLSV